MQKPSSSPKKSFSYNVSTMGCKANLTDSQNLEARLRAMGGKASQSDDVDVYILNSCTVTDRADRDALAHISKAQAKLKIFTGCLAEVDPEAIKATGKNIFLARNSAKLEIADAVQSWLKDEEVEEVLQGDRKQWHQKFDHVENAHLHSESEQRTRAFLKVQDGCNHFCSFCIIPHARGRSRSLEAERIVDQVQKLSDEGVKEIVLTAIHAADYLDQGREYSDLVELVLAKTNIPRLRLTSLDPAELPSRLIDLMASDSRLCPHFHISLQSANSRVLHAMRREYDQKRFEDCLQEISEKVAHSFVGMDVIAGFPGETEAEFNDSLECLKRTSWSRLHVFPYSVRRSTQAALLVKQGLGIPEAEKRQRAKILRDLSSERMHSQLSIRKGRLMDVLTEQKKYQIGTKLFTQAHSKSYIKILIEGDFPANKLLKVQTSGLGPGESLLADLLPNM